MSVGLTTSVGALSLEQDSEHGNHASELRTIAVWNVNDCGHCLLFTVGNRMLH